MPRPEIEFGGAYEAAVWSRDTAAIQAIVAHEFGFAVPAVAVEKWLERLGLPPAGGWSNASVKTWLKLRLDEWYPHAAGERENEARITVELHVFPIWWHTSHDQDERVKRDETPVPESTARSRLGRSKLKQIQPVDVTAMRVAGR